MSARWRATDDAGFGHARLGVARRVAQVMEQHDRARREVELGHVRLAVVLVVVVAVARRRVEPHAVLGRVGRVVRVRAGPAVAVAQVDEHGRPDGGSLDLRPRRVGAVDLDDVRGVLPGFRVRPVGVGAIAGGRAMGGTDDDDDLRIAGRGRDGGHHDAQGGDEDEGDGDGRLAQRWTPMAGCGGGVPSRLGAGRVTLNRGMVPTSLAPSVARVWGGGRSGAVRVSPGCGGCAPAGRPGTGWPRHGPEVIGRPSAVTASVGQGTATVGSSQAKPSSSEPSYSFVTA